MQTPTPMQKKHTSPRDAKPNQRKECKKSKANRDAVRGRWKHPFGAQKVIDHPTDQIAHDRSQWEKVTGSNPSGFKKGDNYPVESVTWDDAKEFIRKLNGKSGYTFRLPTEAEWEYAARSGGKAEKYAGGSDIDAVAWYGSNSGKSTHPVGTKAPNGLGIYDMSGNVWQWCEDVYDENAYKKHQRNNPVSTSGGSSRVLRGGSWSRDATWVRCTFRGQWEPASHGLGGHLGGAGLGIRLVRTN